MAIHRPTAPPPFLARTHAAPAHHAIFTPRSVCLKANKCAHVTKT